MIKKLLIANRGEIAVRVIRAAREMGIRTVAVYSDVDARQMHVALADEAIGLGASESSASYLDMSKIIEAARQTSADAIHPGYGFLSERAEFSRACDDAGLVFVGPPASAMEKLGAKIEAKQLAVRVGVPVTPGYFESGASQEQLREAAARVGFPIMLKASAGGGGRGMRVVRDAEAFDSELTIASDEALKAFGNGEMMIEKLIERPRHIEVQVLADKQGNVACLFERECSIQRRHQKLIEEAPSVCASEELWARMQAAVRALIREAGYYGAGTVEFMFDEASGEFYFLEVNARLQVEHPVTEMITGLDLVQWQLRIASGEPLNLASALMSGERSAMNGHAIEARIVAEDPAASFMPSVGRILAWAEPKRPGIRVDTGYGPGAEIPRYYDSLIAKVIAHGETRSRALARLEAALLDFHVLGVKTNIAYLLDVIRHEGFRDGRFDTGFLGREFANWQPDASLPPELVQIADQAGQAAVVGAAAREAGVWDLADGFRISERPS
ncbi:MAG TPA: biotin carboxylase N-terminal domain-containing protein [Fimbriimonadaceae bacterium]|nr:biotin carboxylase N-terminal domain-containing protein [Fimbriimonadaceae bacterium]